MKEGNLFSAFCPICHLSSHFSGAEEHLLKARKELLLAVREMVDREIERIDERTGKKKSQKRARKVKLEED